jgi:glucuronate isomerase
MHPLLDENILLAGDTARLLYHDAVRGLPIVSDYSMIPPLMLNRNEPFQNVLQLLFQKASMLPGIIPSEQNIENKNDKDFDGNQFYSFSEILSTAPGSSMYFIVHFILQKLFGIQDQLSPKTAPKIWEDTAFQLYKDPWTPQRLLNDLHVSALFHPCSPLDDLKFFQGHRKANNTAFVPLFSPDVFFRIDQPGFLDAVKLLSSATGIQMNTMEDLIRALENRVDYFHANGARAGCSNIQIPKFNLSMDKAEKAWKAAMTGAKLKPRQVAFYQTMLMYRLSIMYAKRNWVHQLRIGCAWDNANVKTSTSCRYISDEPVADRLFELFYQLDTESALPKTILTCGSFYQYETVVFLTQKMKRSHDDKRIQVRLAHHQGIQEIYRQIDTLAEHHVLNTAAGLFADSNCLADLFRQDYYRRMLSQRLGNWVDSGRASQEIPGLKEMCQNIVWHNIKALYSL